MSDQEEFVLVLKSLDAPDEVLVGKEAQRFLRGYFLWCDLHGLDPNDNLRQLEGGNDDNTDQSEARTC